MTSSESILAAKVQALERRCRSLQLGVGGLAAAMLTACLAAAVQSAPEILRAREFVLVGPDGKERGRWSTDGEAASLWCENADGTARVIVSSGIARREPDEEEGETAVVSSPWAGIQAWSHDQDGKAAHTTLGTTGEWTPLGLMFDCGDDSAFLSVGGGQAGLHLESGLDPYGVTDVYATSDGSGIRADWDDQRDAALTADGQGTHVLLSNTDTNPDTEDRPLVELDAGETSGALRIHDGDAVTFEAP